MWDCRLRGDVQADVPRCTTTPELCRRAAAFRERLRQVVRAARQAPMRDRAGRRNDATRLRRCINRVVMVRSVWLGVRARRLPRHNRARWPVRRKQELVGLPEVRATTNRCSPLRRGPRPRLPRGESPRRGGVAGPTVDGLRALDDSLRRACYGVASFISKGTGRELKRHRPNVPLVLSVPTRTLLQQHAANARTYLGRGGGGDYANVRNGSFRNDQ